MKASDLGRFLLFDEGAIRRLAADRASLGAGAALVVLTTVAREYDERDLLREPQLFAVGLALSLGVACMLHVFLRLLFRGRWSAEDKQPAPAPEFLVLLAMVWLTAPLAWIYALPVERWTDPLTAAELNVGALALVALWRVLLLTRVVGILTGTGRWVSWHAVLAPSVVVFSFALSALPGPVLNLMGGARLDPHEEFIAEVKFYGAALAFLLGMALSFALLVQLVWRRGVPARVLSYHAEGWHGLPRGFLCACVVGWLALAAVYQPQVRRALAFNHAVVSKDLETSKALLARFRQQDWPPRIPLQPDPTARDAGDTFAAVLKSGLVDQLPDGHWYRAAVLEILARPDFVLFNSWGLDAHGSRAIALAEGLAGSRAAMAWLEAHPDTHIQFRHDPTGRARALLAPFLQRQNARFDAAMRESMASFERAVCDFARARYSPGGGPDRDRGERLEAARKALEQIQGHRYHRYDPADEKLLSAYGSWTSQTHELLEAIRLPAKPGPFASLPPKHGSMIRLLRTSSVLHGRKELQAFGVQPPPDSALWALLWALESGHIMNAALERSTPLGEARTVISDSAPLETPGVRALIASCEGVLAALERGPAPALVEAAARQQRAFLADLPPCARNPNQPPR
jgi:hypothetical protein